MLLICLEGIFKVYSKYGRSNNLGMFDRHSKDSSFSVFSIAIKLWLVPNASPVSINIKSGRALAYPQERESKPYTHKQENTLRI